MFTPLARFWLQNTALCRNFEMGHGRWLASFGCLWTTAPGSEIRETLTWRFEKVHSLCSKSSKNAVITCNHPKYQSTSINQCQSAQEWLCEPGVRVLVPPVARSLMCNAPMPNSCHAAVPLKVKTNMLWPGYSPADVELTTRSAAVRLWFCPNFGKI